MQTHASCFLLAACLMSQSCMAARILAAFHYPGGSHFNTLGTLLRELAAGGHEVTVLGHSPQNDAPANYTDISIEGCVPSVSDNLSFQRYSYALQKDVGLLEVGNLLKIVTALLRMDFNNCKVSLEHPATQKLIREIRAGERQFDMLLVHALNTECFDPVAHLLGGVPLVVVSTNMLLSWSAERVGNPHNPSYVGNYFLPYETGNMSFYQRILNTLYQFFIKRVRYTNIHRPTEELHRKYLGTDLPPLDDTLVSTKLILVNSHWSLNGGIPLQPNVVDVGGLHIKKPKPLLQDLDAFLSGAVYGAVYVSFGSLFAFHTMHLEKMAAVLEALASLPQHVLLRCDPSKLPSSVILPVNVRAQKWTPQLSVLAHPSLRLFVTHGGMHSTIEAVHFGVPLLGIPLVIDQKLTLNRMETLGVAVQQDYSQMTAESLGTALRTVLTNSSFRERAQQLSARFKDRPRPPLEEAVYWVEYVLRHKGAPHLRSNALDLAWYQYLLLDVAVVVAILPIVATVALYGCLSRLMTCMRSRVQKLESA